MMRKVILFAVCTFLAFNLTTSQLCTVPESLRSCQPTCEFKNPPCYEDIDPEQMCQCDPGHILLSYSNTTCVPIEECPSACSKPNLYWNDCGTRCRETCEKRDSQPCVKICEPGCFCEKGLLLDSSNMECIEPSDCPSEN